MSQLTINKHITWITQVLEHAAGDEGKGHQPERPLDFAKARKNLGSNIGSKRQRKRDARASWTPAEISRLLSAPIWSGCAGLHARFEPGHDVIHDAWYWLPLMLVIYGSRSSELAGLPIADVFEDAIEPHFRIDYSDDRALKNVQSIRSLPIHPELVRLGFLDYARAIRSAGHLHLFPELVSAKSRSFASTFYKSVFVPWRDWAFPTGTSWRHTKRGIMKDKDVHSFRHAAVQTLKRTAQDSLLSDIVGHEGSTTTTSVYGEEAELSSKAAALEVMTAATAHIEAKPLNLRPVEWRRFGARVGDLEK